MNRYTAFILVVLLIGAVTWMSLRQMDARRDSPQTEVIFEEKTSPTDAPEDRLNTVHPPATPTRPTPTFEFPDYSLPLELPYFTEADEVIAHTGYTLAYSEPHEQALWVAYTLSTEKLVAVAKRTNRFLIDPKVREGSATDADYKNSGYDRGHLAPAADMAWSDATMRESFYFSNMSPQVPAFNRGVWKRLEEQVRVWARENEHLYIVTGPVLHESLRAIGPNHVAVPEIYYKVLLDLTEPEWKGIGFLVQNEASTAPLGQFSVTIDSVQRLTGIDFFHHLPDSLENALEGKFSLQQWGLDK
jgi:endonuclease G, mitochondrial